MEVRALLDVLHIAERLKDELRHCETSRSELASRLLKDCLKSINRRYKKMMEP